MRKLLNSFILFFLIKDISSKYVEGVLKTRENWAFLARFCFLSEKGEFEYSLEFSEDQGFPNLLLYYDTADQWNSVYRTEKTCLEKEAILHVNQLQVINLTVRQPYLKALAGCDYVGSTGITNKPRYSLVLPTLPPQRKTTPLNYYNSSDYLDFEVNNTTTESHQIVKRSVINRGITCHNARSFRSARERWWFIAISNCNGTKGIHVKYKLLMTNGPFGDYWHQHFSADEFYILPVLVAFSVAYSFLTLAIITCSLELKSRQLLHTSYKVFLVSALFQFLGIILTSAAYLRYAVNGIGSPKLKTIGTALMGVSETFYLLLLLLLAKGYTVTRGRLPIPATVKITVFLCLYVVTYVSIFIYEAKVFDPGEVLYLYESPAGYGLITLRMLAWVMFVYSTIFTLKHYPEKSNFYYPFNVCGTLWFVAGPAFILSANTYIDKWVRESIVCAVLQFITFGGHLTFLILTMPSVANKNFPYHVRTTQIGISTIEQFGHHAYQPTEISPNHSPKIEDYTNVTMENVTSWSMARNIQAIEIPEFHEPLHQSEQDSIYSRRSSANPIPMNDYVREVPLQLFTISRMTVEAVKPDTPNGKSV